MAAVATPFKLPAPFKLVIKSFAVVVVAGFTSIAIGVPSTVIVAVKCTVETPLTAAVITWKLVNAGNNVPVVITILDGVPNEFEVATILPIFVPDVGNEKVAPDAVPPSQLAAVFNCVINVAKVKAFVPAIVAVRVAPPFTFKVNV